MNNLSGQKNIRKHKGRIVEVYSARGGAKRIIQGIKKDKQPFYEDLIGGNGTYLGSDETYPVIYVKVSVYDFDNRAINVDIREIVFDHYEWHRISENRIFELKNKLVGKKVIIIEIGEQGSGMYEIENIESLL